MPTTVSFDFELDDSGLDWFRLRITTERGVVTNFTVPYETVIEGRRLAIVRYDCAHGFPLRDVMDRRGGVTKGPLRGNPSVREALQIGERDIRLNWRAYRRCFLGEEP